MGVNFRRLLSLEFFKHELTVFDDVSLILVVAELEEQVVEGVEVMSAVDHAKVEADGGFRH